MFSEEKKKKIENFWFYYKWHTIAAIFAAIIIAYTVHDAVTKVNPDLGVDIIMDTGFTYDTAEILSADLETSGIIKDNNGDEKIKSQITILQTGKDPSTVSADGSMMQVVQLRMAVGEASVVITEPYILDLYAELDIFEDLTSIADEMNIPAEKRYMSADGTKVAAINIDGCKFLSDKNIITKDCYISHRALNLDQQKKEEKTKEHSNAEDVIKYILK